MLPTAPRRISSTLALAGAGVASMATTATISDAPKSLCLMACRLAHPKRASGRTLTQNGGSLEPQNLGVADLRQGPDTGEQLVGHHLVDPDQRDGVGAGVFAAEVEGGDVDPGFAQHGAERADEA